jgi:hypothetical protein
MNGELELIERKIADAEEVGNHPELQRLYLRRERLQEREFKASLARRAKLAKEKR